MVKEQEDGPSNSHQIRVRGADGQWRDIEVASRKSDDPETDALWRMKLSELEPILMDPDHPLHDKAQAVQREIMAPALEAINTQLRPMIGRINRSMSLPELRIPKIEHGIPEVPQPASGPWLSRWLATVPETNESAKANDRGSRRLPEVDLLGSELPDATTAEVAGAVTEAVELAKAQARSLSVLVQHSESNRLPSLAAAWAAVVAAVLAAASLVVQILR